jgi:hypothetical protein
MKKYTTNCVNSSATALEAMLERAEEISFEEFAREIDTTELRRLFPHYDWAGSTPGGLRLRDDYMVSCWRSRFKGRPCVFVCHSCIEYIFC